MTVGLWAGVAVGVAEAVAVGVSVGVTVAVAVAVGVAVGSVVPVGGTVVTGGTVAPVLHSLFVNVLLSSVTEPFRASARPSTVEAALMVIEVKARIEPTKRLFAIESVGVGSASLRR